MSAVMDVHHMANTLTRSTGSQTHLVEHVQRGSRQAGAAHRGRVARGLHPAHAERVRARPVGRGRGGAGARVPELRAAHSGARLAPSFFQFVCAGSRSPVFPSPMLLDCEAGCMCARCMCATRHGRCARRLLACRAHSRGRSARLHLHLSTGEERTVNVHRRSWLALPRLRKAAAMLQAGQHSAVHVCTCRQLLFVVMLHLQVWKGWCAGSE